MRKIEKACCVMLILGMTFVWPSWAVPVVSYVFAIYLILQEEGPIWSINLALSWSLITVIGVAASGLIVGEPTYGYLFGVFFAALATRSKA